MTSTTAQSQPTSASSPLVLDIFGQQPGLSNLYTQLTFAFSLPSTPDPISQQADITRTLTIGLARLSASFPWVAGQVINTGADPSAVPPNTGVYAIVPLRAAPELVVRDLRSDETMTMDALRTAQFPFSRLSESVLSPRTTLHLSPLPPPASPVFVVQATFVRGGVLVTFVAQHNVMDITSQAQVIRLFDKACKGEAFSEEELRDGNVDREHAIPLLGTDWTPEEEPSLPSPPYAPSLAEQPPPPSKCTWEYFSFSSASLKALKDLAASTLPPTTRFVSTDDALTAFIWQRIIHARRPRLSHTQQTSTLARAIDPRRFVGLADTYPGLVQNMTYHTFPPSELVDMPLGAAAAHLRAALATDSPQSVGHATRAFATRLARSPNKNVASVTSSLDLPGYDLMLSSWANQGPLYALDFGLLSSALSSSAGSSGAKLDAIRRPAFTTFESLLYLLPRAPEGEVLLGACLRDVDMERLRADEVFGRWGEWIG